jgi:signal transduction histidine kinase
MSQKLADANLPAHDFRTLLSICSELAPRVTQHSIPSPAAIRRTARGLREQLEGAGVEESVAVEVARSVAELAPPQDVLDRMFPLLTETETARTVAGYVTEYVYLHRAGDTIGNAIRRIQRIVGGLKSYSHLDQEADRVDANVVDGIESTLVLFDHLLTRDIKVTRSYGDIPMVPVYVDELNQVWTNLIHNAIQALEGQGSLTIETEATPDGVAVRIIDNGPGIPSNVLPRIFEPFYTTKKKGEGTGLGLGIVQQIVDKHGGRVRAESEPGRTCFEVLLPCAVLEAGSETEGATA